MVGASVEETQAAIEQAIAEIPLFDPGTRVIEIRTIPVPSTGEVVSEEVGADWRMAGVTPTTVVFVRASRSYAEKEREAANVAMNRLFVAKQEATAEEVDNSFSDLMAALDEDAPNDN